MKLSPSALQGNLGSNNRVKFLLAVKKIAWRKKTLVKIQKYVSNVKFRSTLIKQNVNI